MAGPCRGRHAALAGRCICTYTHTYQLRKPRPRIMHCDAPPLPNINGLPYTRPPNTPNTHQQMVQRSAIKAVTAGFAGAVLTNPLDVLRNECFKREQPVRQALRGLYRDEGLAFLHR